MDQTLSDSDQAQADVDQRASDQDQAASDLDLSASSRDERARLRAHEQARVERAEATLDRHAGTLVRAEVSSERDTQATQRDDVARKRDRVAAERDQAAAEYDRELERLAGDLERRGALDVVEALATMRARVAAQRAGAGADRERAASDREAAAEDRQHLLRELERAHLDELTGAYRREMGEIALVHEIERARRSQSTLTLAYIDCDGLKDVNDREGHAAGDALLRDLVGLLRSNLRPYDPVVRSGGDEFVCAVSDTDLEAARARFDRVREALAKQHPGTSVTVGLAALRDGDTLDALIERADGAVLEARRGR
jgi:diguanylate cyclase (GGDEF)-like protein